MKDQYLYNMKLVEKLLQFLSSKELFGLKIIWNPKLAILEIESVICDSIFMEDFGWAVYNIISENARDIQDCYNDFIDDMTEQSATSDIDDAKFTRLALKIAPLFFPKGYSHASFLSYCAMVIGVSYSFLILKPNCIPQRACQVVAHVLFSHQMTGQFYEEGGWRVFQQTVLQFNNSIRALLDKHTSVI